MLETGHLCSLRNELRTYIAVGVCVFPVLGAVSRLRRLAGVCTVYHVPQVRRCGATTTGLCTRALHDLRTAVVHVVTG